MSIDQAYGLPASMIEYGDICDEVKDAWRNYVMAIIQNYKIGSNFKLVLLSKEERAAQKRKVQQDSVPEHPDRDQGWQAPEASNRYCTEYCR
jgi:hypothetical protein